MRVLIAPQEFKGSLTAVEAATAFQVGVSRVLPEAEIDRAAASRDGGPRHGRGDRPRRSRPDLHRPR